jgi:hypothetical protein
MIMGSPPPRYLVPCTPQLLTITGQACTDLVPWGTVPGHLLGHPEFAHFHSVNHEHMEHVTGPVFSADHAAANLPGVSPIDQTRPQWGLDRLCGVVSPIAPVPGNPFDGTRAVVEMSQIIDRLVSRTKGHPDDPSQPDKHARVVELFGAPDRHQFTSGGHIPHTPADHIPDPDPAHLAPPADYATMMDLGASARYAEAYGAPRPGESTGRHAITERFDPLTDDNTPEVPKLKHPDPNDLAPQVELKLPEHVGEFELDDLRQALVEDRRDRIERSLYDPQGTQLPDDEVADFVPEILRGLHAAVNERTTEHEALLTAHGKTRADLSDLRLRVTGAERVAKNAVEGTTRQYRCDYAGDAEVEHHPDMTCNGCWPTNLITELADRVGALDGAVDNISGRLSEMDQRPNPIRFPLVVGTQEPESVELDEARSPWWFLDMRSVLFGAVVTTTMGVVARLVFGIG